VPAFTSAHKNFSGAHNSRALLAKPRELIFALTATDTVAK